MAKRSVCGASSDSGAVEYGSGGAQVGVMAAIHQWAGLLQGSLGMQAVALRHHVTRAAFAAAALGGHAEFELNAVEAQARMGTLGNLPVGYTLAHTDDHDE